MWAAKKCMWHGFKSFCPSNVSSKCGWAVSSVVDKIVMIRSGLSALLLAGLYLGVNVSSKLTIWMKVVHYISKRGWSDFSYSKKSTNGDQNSRPLSFPFFFFLGKTIILWLKQNRVKDWGRNVVHTHVCMTKSFSKCCCLALKAPMTQVAPKNGRSTRMIILEFHFLYFWHVE